jgi:hypothetical protein
MMPYACPSWTPHADSNADAASAGSAAVVESASRTVSSRARRPACAIRANWSGEP